MKSIIISIGDELIAGDITNTNSAFIAAELNRHHIEVDRIITLGDDYQAIYHCLENIPEGIDKIFISGGLGPTHDDITQKVAADFFDTKLVFQQDLYDNLVARFRKFRFKMTEANRSQAYFPLDCKRIINNHGTATGMEFQKEGKTFYFMPGVPYEMKTMLLEQILPKMLPGKSGELKLKVIRTYGEGESNLYERMKDWMNSHPDIKVAFYPKYSGNDVKLLYPQPSAPAVDQLIHLLGPLVYGFDHETIEEKIAEKLLEKKLTLAVAESCTGGLISSRLTDVPGSSAYLMLGLVTYSNEAKTKLLGVRAETIKKCGAVSRETAIEMAMGARQKSGCDIGISTTGIAGPTGGSDEKPVGTLWCAISCGDTTESYHFYRNINRKANKIIFSQFIFKKLLEKLY